MPRCPLMTQSGQVLTLHFVFCSMRHNTPVGSIITKSRIVEGLSASGSIFGVQFLSLNVAPPDVDVFY